MKILMIHSNGVKVTKNKEATSNPQEFPEDHFQMDGLVLVCYVSVEDQDTYDADLIAKQGAEEIENAILLISGFPEWIKQKNEEIREYNRKIEKGEIKGKTRIVSYVYNRRQFIHHYSDINSLNKEFRSNTSIS